MKKINVMENRNRLFLVTLTLAVLAVVVIFLLPVKRSAIFAGGYRITYSYELETEPVPEGENVDSINTLFDDLTIPAFVPKTVALDTAAVKTLVETTLSVETKMIDDAPTTSGENLLTFTVSSATPPTEEAVANLSGVLNETFLINNFTLTNISPVASLLTRQLMTRVLVVGLIGLIILGIWLGLRFSEIGGLGVTLLMAVSAFFVEMMVLAGFVVAQIPLGESYIAVALAMFVFSIYVTVSSFQYLQNDCPRPTKDTLESSINHAINTLLPRHLVVLVLSLILVLAGAVVASTKSAIAYQAVLALPIVLGLVAAIFVVLCFSLPFWGSSLDFEESVRPASKKAKKTPAKPAKNKAKKVATPQPDEETFEDFADEEAAEVAAKVTGVRRDLPASGKKSGGSGKKGKGKAKNKKK